MWVRLRPLDTVFFRDGKPFLQGEETWGDSVFPPPPSIFYGALRTLYFAQYPAKFTELHNGIDDTTNLRLTAIYLENQGKTISRYYLPTPHDVVVFDKEEDSAKFEFLQPVKAQTSCPASYLLKTLEGDGKADEPEPLLSTSAYEKYLAGQIPRDKDSFKPIPIVPEPKVGIGRDDVTHVTGEEGRLYRVDMLRLATREEELSDRPEPWGFLLEFSGLELEKGTGILKLGGEHKAARYEIFDNHLIVSPPPTPFEYFKLCLTTPAIFNNGWYPNLDKFGKAIKLLAAAVGKPQFIGGFDMKERKPKPMYRAVPAGSVYYFQCPTQCSQDLVSSLHGKAISDIYPEQGFGIAYIGKILDFPE